MERANKINLAIRISIGIFGSMFLFSACTKQRAATQSTGPDYSPASSFYNTYKQPLQIIQVDSPGTGPIFGKMGTRLSGDASIFMYPGNPSKAVIYPITLNLIEIYPEKDMILSQMPSVGGSTILQTGGEIYITAYKGTQQLVLRPGKKYTMYLDTSKSLITGMSVYYGFAGSGAIAFTDWTSNVNQLNPAIGLPDTLSKVINLPLFYQMNIAQMGWVNCAQASPGQSANLTFSVPVNSTNTQNLNVFLACNSFHSMVQVYGLSCTVSIPIGTTFTAVAIAQDANSNNSLVYCSQNITVTGSAQIIALNPTTISSANLITDLSAFH